MTKEDAIQAATKIANEQDMVMAVVNDPISNNPEDDPDGPWNFCPNCAKGADGKFILFRWATEVIVISPA